MSREAGGVYNWYLIDQLTEELLNELDERADRRYAGRGRYPARDLGRLRREVYQELNALRALENRLRRSRVSPGARAVLAGLLEESAGRGQTMDELYRMLPRPALGDRLAGLLQPRYGMYLLLALLIILAVPSTREAVKPVLKKVIAEVSDLGEQLQGILSKLKEGIEDVVAEARFEKLKEEMEQAASGKTPESEPENG
ncbi:hypothetical protein [Desulfotomaculum copahuensis]|uniref:Uncharacterized protein n=1 Tax=Desulfotomaculum copahuensis TaxID=1838280 RepID=A0A1B7LHW7_9FIRM|nr:hypothetical protein [Desulfotomaculum copahuensis]OAT85793.1 hypothetical protein A6M21_04685 [Desulfotomaculum copahuensis]